MKKYAVIVAGGSGTRLGGELPKQFLDLCGRPLLWWSMKAFRDEDPSTRIILVLNPGFISLWRSLEASLPESDRIECTVLAGGASRTESVVNGLEGVDDSSDAFVAVHDAARPLVTPSVISKGWEKAQESGAAVPSVPVTDSLRRLTGTGSEAVDRSSFVAVQTPQVFRASLLKAAYRANPGGVFTDDASAIEQSGGSVSLFEGSHSNIKVTNPGDVEIASLLLENG